MSDLTAILDRLRAGGFAAVRASENRSQSDVAGRRLAACEGLCSQLMSNRPESRTQVAEMTEGIASDAL